MTDERSGSISWPAETASRARIACGISGAMAEAGLGTLSIADPRACRTRIVQGRVTNLPSELSTAAPGTTISGEGVAILIDEGWIRWVATGDIARALEQLSKTEDNLPGLS